MIQFVNDTKHTSSSLYQLVYYVPRDHLEKVNAAVFASGAGRLGFYEECCFMQEGVGQFKPIDGANPSIGKRNQVERVPEVKVEIMLSKNLIEPVVSALKKAHPYEEVAFGFWPCRNMDD
jgi:hypothetical protein